MLEGIGQSLFRQPDLAQYLHQAFKYANAMKQDGRGYRDSKMPARNVNRGAFVLLLLLFIGVPFFGSAQTKKEKDMTTASDDKAAIRALEGKFAAAFNDGDID